MSVKKIVIKVVFIILLVHSSLFAQDLQHWHGRSGHDEVLVAEANKLVGIVSNNQIEAAGKIQSESVLQLLDQAQIVVGFNLEYGFSILERGLLNQHSDLTSTMADSNKQLRMELESLIAGVNLSKSDLYSDPKFLPKYGFAIFPNDTAHLMYGTAFIVLDPKVKSRATWTPQDSFRINIEQQAKQFLHSSKIESSLYSKGVINTFTSAPDVDISQMSASRKYKEAQIWGPISNSDFAEIVLPSVFYTTEWFIPFQKQLIEKIFDLNIKVSVFDSTLNGQGGTYHAFQNRKVVSKEQLYKHIEFLTLDNLSKRSGGYFRHPDSKYYEHLVRSSLRKHVFPFLPKAFDEENPYTDELLKWKQDSGQIKLCRQMFTSAS